MASASSGVRSPAETAAAIDARPASTLAALSSGGSWKGTTGSRRRGVIRSRQMRIAAMSPAGAAFRFQLCCEGLGAAL